MFKLHLVAIFSIFHVMSFAQKPFTGDVTERDYINRFGYMQIIKTESSETTQGKVVKTIFTFGENSLLATKTVQDKEVLTSQYSYDDKDNIVEIATKNANGKLYSFEKYGYDKLNRLKESETRQMGDNSKKTEKILWLEDDTRHLTRWNNDKEVKILTNFDKYNRPLSELVDDGSGTEWLYLGILPVMKKYKMGESLLNIERYDFDTENCIATIENTQIRKIFHYDNAGLLLKAETFDTNGVMIGWEKYEYAFDAK